MARKDSCCGLAGIGPPKIIDAPTVPDGAARPRCRSVKGTPEAADLGVQRLHLPESMTGAGWATEYDPYVPVSSRAHPSAGQAALDDSELPAHARRLPSACPRRPGRLWDERPQRVQLIHLHHLDLRDRVIAHELSSRLERPQYEPVIRADIASQPGGEPSHAEHVDEHMGPRFGRRLATTVYLYSLTRGVPGVSAAELFGAVLSPSDDLNLLQKALDVLESSCWYLHADVRGYRFSTEASLVKLIQEAEREISVPKSRTRATKILSEQFKDGALKVRRAWEYAKVSASPTTPGWWSCTGTSSVTPAALILTPQSRPTCCSSGKRLRLAVCASTETGSSS